MSKSIWVIASLFFIIAAFVNFLQHKNTVSISFIALSIALAVVGFYSSKSTK